MRGNLQVRFLGEEVAVMSLPYPTETGFETEGAAIEAGERVRQLKEKRGYRAAGGYKNTGNNPAQ